jgi:6-phosphofructokinase 2
MSDRSAIATFTLNPAIDKSSSVARVEPEAKLRCAPPAFEPGGGGINVSRVIQELGGRAHTLYTAGGPTGELLKSLVAGHGLQHKAIEIAEMTRENLVIFEEWSGEQYRFNMPGPRISAEEADHIVGRLAALDEAYIVASGSLPPGMPVDFYARPAARYRERGQRYILDTSGPALQAALESFVYLIKPNMRELRGLVGHDVATPEAAQEAALELVGSGHCECVAVSLGAEGAIMADTHGAVRIDAPDITPVSKVGAGDSMVAGIVYLLTQGASPAEAVRYGVAAGAAACLTPGTGLCRREDVNRLFAAMS